MKNVNKLAIPALITALALGTAVPASAAGWGHNGGQLRSQIAQLDRQIDRAEHRRLLSWSEANRLERRVENLKDMHQRYARNGFTRAELRILDRRVETVHRLIDRQIGERDNYRDGRNGRYYR